MQRKCILEICNIEQDIEDCFLSMQLWLLSVRELDRLLSLDAAVPVALCQSDGCSVIARLSLLRNRPEKQLPIRALGEKETRGDLGVRRSSRR